MSMTDAQISRALALAIGYQESDFYQGDDGSYVAVKYHMTRGWYWREFDYRDPAVIWPIAERYDCFPRRFRVPGYPGADGYNWDARGVIADTAAKAVALAVIRANGGEV